ncbi:UPF0545 protein C22orf39 homolog [Ornithorhynchus anatinus]|uniref:UPF0545 protein C22orf39 homolog n=1 Tax=Ornithorhynchus anatinus TaxID=9258 RepID=UPI0010A908B3|nr:UPF0545 protein C22orf39 homolog [Ornithorhynchus anatinus]
MAGGGGGAWRPPRSCQDYWAEWTLCRSLRNLVHHYYAFGEAPACAQWKRDFANCQEWEERRSPGAQQALRDSERARLRAGRQPHAPVWTPRRRPPEDWHSPLPGEDASE